MGYKLVIYDRHKSHIQPEVASMAMQSKVEILTLPQHTSHVLQPLDKRVFGPFKAALKREIDSVADLGTLRLTFPSCVVQQWIRASQLLTLLLHLLLQA